MKWPTVMICLGFFALIGVAVWLSGTLWPLLALLVFRPTWS